jgi:hypothetical protein
MTLTGFAANGLYNLGRLALNLLGFANHRLPRPLLWFGLPSWLLGLGLSAATAAQHFTLALLFTAASMTLSLAWMLAVTLVVFRHGQRFKTP